MKIKIIIAVFCSVLCGYSSALNIGVTMTSLDNPFLTILLNGMKTQAQTTPDLHLQIEDANLDVGRQLNQVQSFIASGVDAIIVNAVDGDSTMAITQLTEEAHIPLVYVNHPPIDVDRLPDTASFIGSNELDSGTLQTKAVCQLLNGRGNVVIIMGPLENHSAHTRTQDVRDVITTPECAGIRIVDNRVANWSRTEAYDLMSNWLTSGIQFDAVIANNDEMAIGAIQALKAAHADMESLVIAGIDATPDGLRAMAAGDLDITVYQNAKEQGAAAIRAAQKLATGQSVPRNIWIPFELVTPANMERYLQP
ncbi:sugar ABC transporter substrate-binding protein [Gynuella sunshinyii]|uniref:ABC-type sugar transport system, periplasmic component n=1 Tax=Gynuella sunshinyii YC6258 TaxID=1445510 RepID=A0A0C5VT67_9GAMM|nr:sugar ABC transporter substrate-binding protein [Gynuella sunshinyii]AJQ97381.1 ABC-type sugar transport system, periplasmic component [Gynuella sunshinyii YC6258]